MKGGCYLTIALLTGLILGYQAILRPYAEPPELWICASIMGVLSWLCLGALWSAWSLAGTIRALGHAREGAQPGDGELTAIYGRLQPYEKPILAPMSGQPCVLYEYEITRMQRTQKQTQKLVDFAGIGMAPCEIQSETETLALLGYPDIEDFPSVTCGPGTRSRAREYVDTTEWKDCSGLNLLRGAREMWGALTSRGEEIREDYRMIGPKDCHWLGREGEPPDEQRQRDRRDDYHPTITEKRLNVGIYVTALGIYRADSQALTTQTGTTLQRLQLLPGTIEQEYQKARSSRRAYVRGGLFGLIFFHAVAYGMLQLYLHSKAAKEQQKQAVVWKVPTSSPRTTWQVAESQAAAAVSHN